MWLMRLTIARRKTLIINNSLPPQKKADGIEVHQANKKPPNECWAVFSMDKKDVWHGTNLF